MKIISKPMGDYQTNCYIVTVDGKDLIIDPGMGATTWVLEHAKNPIAILNTHGHFDHVWSNAELKEKLAVPLYAPKADATLLATDHYNLGMQPSCADIEVEGDQEFNIEGVSFSFHHYPGHTPGCSSIEIQDAMFSGDFIFKQSIGRVDFPMSNPEHMKESLKRFAALEYDKTVYPGHGPSTSIKEEQQYVPYWLQQI